MNLKGKVLTVQESMERMRKDGISRIIVSYEDTGIGKGVLSYENGKFTRLVTVDNNPNLLGVKEIPYSEGLAVLKLIVREVYKLKTYVLVKDPSLVPSLDKEREFTPVRKEVVL
ncbi:hypothetical protein [Gracilibacillus thailandensis]|uniref:Uncharacterized protein n=1 Tax=Gracilibacillus thailandensis TaxID=563735 RepID=A0A6N7QZ66_9BACI|nr:hypothetical protein [Gracilibacillus thailandensis]MRI66181.1 hypothetical protein [Gracilibacillus thailandensis]